MGDRFDIEQVLRITGLGIRADQADGGADFDVACSIAVKKIWKAKEYEDLEEQGRLLKLPCAVGDTVYVLTECENIPAQLDGTLYGANGEPGTATGYYCPYEDNCPFDDEDFEGCEKYKNKTAVFEDTVGDITIGEDGRNGGEEWRLNKFHRLTSCLRITESVLGKMQGKQTRYLKKSDRL